MWTFVQSSGEMINGDGLVVGKGYAGNGEGLNNPAMQDVENKGPLPQGRYTIGPLQASHGKLGTNVAALDPAAGNEMFGRGDFFCHGRKGPDDMDASEGCIVLDHDPRMTVLKSGDRDLQVVAVRGVIS